MSHFGRPRSEREDGGGSSAEEGELALPAAHPAAHVGQYVVNVPPDQLEARAAAAGALQAALLSGGPACKHKMQIFLKKSFTQCCVNPLKRQAAL